MSTTSPIKPNAQVAARIEELLREQLTELGVNVSTLEPHEIIQNMVCHLGPDDSLTYSWQGRPLLYAFPEITQNGTIAWRMFTQDEQERGDEQED